MSFLDKFFGTVIQEFTGGAISGGQTFALSGALGTIPFVNGQIIPVTINLASVDATATLPIGVLPGTGYWIVTTGGVSGTASKKLTLTGPANGIDSSITGTGPFPPANNGLCADIQVSQTGSFLIVMSQLGYWIQT